MFADRVAAEEIFHKVGLTKMNIWIDSLWFGEENQTCILPSRVLKVNWARLVWQRGLYLLRDVNDGVVLFDWRMQETYKCQIIHNVKLCCFAFFRNVAERTTSTAESWTRGKPCRHKLSERAMRRIMSLKSSGLQLLQKWPRPRRCVKYTLRGNSLLSIDKWLWLKSFRLVLITKLCLSRVGFVDLSWPQSSSTSPFFFSSY